MNTVIRRRWAWLSVPLIVAAAGTFALQISGAPSADAASGRVLVSATSAKDSEREKRVLIVCPEGKVATGVLATTSRPQSVHITELWPAMGVAYASARETLGTSANWQLTGTAICINLPAGLEYVSETESDPPASGYDFVGASALCPGDKQLIGFGGKTSGGRLHSLWPSSSSGSTVPNQMWVSTTPFAGTTVDDLVAKSVAVCANPGQSPRNYEGPTESTASGTLDNTYQCQDFKLLLAVGGSVEWLTKTAYFSGYSSSASTVGTHTSNNSESGFWSSTVVLLCASTTK